MFLSVSPGRHIFFTSFTDMSDARRVVSNFCETTGRDPSGI